MFDAVEFSISISHFRKPKRLKNVGVFEIVLIVNSKISGYKHIQNKQNRDLRLSHSGNCDPYEASGGNQSTI
jgi:hypothetical protein